MKKIETKDGSITFLNEEYGDTYHSTTVGALDEARVKYVQPANLKKGDNVLDFCFGLGYNSLMAIVYNVNIIGIEKDRDILKEVLTNVPPYNKKDYELIQKAVFDALNGDKNPIKIIIGDGLEEAKKFESEYFNAVLFDPFSPSKIPEMWSREVFDEMYRIMKPGSRLTTYSCATWVRNNMRDSGFEVIDGPIFGRKSSSTVAIKN